MMAKLHINMTCRASLYERPVNLEAAKKAHTEFRRTMRAAGLKVLTIRDILSFGVEDHMGARVELEELATRALQFQLAEGVKLEEFHEKVVVCLDGTAELILLAAGIAHPYNSMGR